MRTAEASAGQPSGCIVVVAKGRGPERERARLLSERVGLPVMPFRESGLPRLVIERAGLRLETVDGTIRSHPGMGLVRLRRLMREQEHDPLLDHAALQPGESVLDATFGFGQDALVMAWAVGETGRVTALEASPLLAGLACEGMPRWAAPADRIARRIELVRADARDYLARSADRSFDLVYLDPMFRRPQSAAPDFVVLRSLAEMEPLSVETLNHARRVARRLVIVKDAWPGHELVRLGREPVDRMRRADIVFGTWPALS